MKKFGKLLIAVFLLPILGGLSADPAESGKEDDAGKEAETGKEKEKESDAGKEEEEKKFTQKDIDKMIAARLKNQEKVINEKVAEAAKLAKMSAEERLKVEMDNREVEVSEKERKIAAKEMLAEIQETLEDETINLPKKLAKYMMADNADDAKANIVEFKKIWDKELEKAVNVRIAGVTPKAGTAKEIQAEQARINAIRQAAGLKSK